MNDELVLGIARERLFDDGDFRPWRGLRPDGAERVLDLVRQHGHFRPRSVAEDDPSWKQLIPYLVVRDADRVWLMRRSRAGGDARLHDRFSIGVGGHLNPDDGDVLGGLRREFDEELDAPWEPRFTLLGVLNADDDAVGQVHLGLVYEADAGGRRVAIRETHKLQGRFAVMDEVEAVRDRLETWSALVLDHLLGRPPAAPPRDVG
jgi:predicted NUDIX family phosphoesterase